MTDVDPQILISIGGALAVLGIGVWKNRSDLRRLTDAIFGHERKNGGQAEELDTLGSQLNRIESKLDEEREKRVQHHQTIESEIMTNRFMMTRSVNELVAELNRELDDAEIEGPKAVPSEEHINHTSKWQSEDE